MVAGVDVLVRVHAELAPVLRNLREAPDDRVAATEDAAVRQRVGRFPLNVVCEILPDSLQIAAPESFICGAHRLDVLD